MLQSLTGWHFLILLAVVLLISAAIIVGVVLLVRRAASAAPATAAPAVGRLQQLDALRAQGAVTEEEYSSRRAAILAEL